MSVSFSDTDYEYESESDGENMNLNTSEQTFSSISRQKGSAPYQLLNVQQVVEAQDVEIRKVQEILGGSKEKAKLLLIHFNYSSEDLMNVFLQKGGEYVYKSCGVISDDNAPKDQALSETDAAKMKDCDICCGEYKASEFLTNDCGHEFCKNCWQHQVSMFIKEGKACRIGCMAHKCSIAVVEKIIFNVIQDKELLKKYQNALNDSYVEFNPRAAWCISTPFCGHGSVIDIKASKRNEVECACKEIYCFNCREPSHTPLPCEWRKKWATKCADESETANYIQSNCKPCPKCQKMIEKNSGCNHVTCICGQSMCWLCAAAVGKAHSYSSIEGHTCGKYRAAENAHDARIQLERYVHYFKRFQAHMDSLKMASKLTSNVDKTISELEHLGEKSSAMSEGAPTADWLKVGLSQLLRMRSIIANSYAFAYYCFYGEIGENVKAIQKRLGQADFHLQELFESIQSQFENSIEQLSNYVETKAGNMNAESKAGVLKFISLTHRNCAALFDVIQTEIIAPDVENTLNIQLAAYFPIMLLQTHLGITSGSNRSSFNSVSYSANTSPTARLSPVTSSSSLERTAKRALTLSGSEEKKVVTKRTSKRNKKTK